MSIKAMKATPHKQLIDELMDCRIPKTEREHAAAREIERLRQAIETAEKQEPVAWVQDVEFEQLPEFAFSWVKTRLHDKPLYTHPPKREWVGLTEEDLSVCDEDGVILARYWEAKLREKNGC